MTMITAPDRTETAEYYFTYIDQVGGGDICAILENQLAETLALLNGISEARSLHRYAPDKWSIRQVLSHLNDTERLFIFRAFWFARGFDSPLPSFDQNIAARGARADYPSEVRPSPSSGTFRQTPGRGAASRAGTRSRCARSPILRPGTTRITSAF